MSISAYAEHVGVDRKTITRWIKSNQYIVMEGKKIDVEASDANLRRYRDGTDIRTRNAKKKPDVETDQLKARAKEIYDELSSGKIEIRDIEESRAIKEHYLAELTKLEHSIKAGEVLPYKDMIEAVGQEYSRMRTRLIAIAPEHGPRLRVLASTTNDTEFVQALQEVVYEAMEELSLDDNNRGES
ncbi:hypothetical protein BB987_09155 [Photorhabdus temperata]|nr:hypothetical protein BB987_09155 [Photorhabdus temperata]